MAPMTKVAIIAHLAEASKLSKRQVSKVLDALRARATKELKHGFSLPGFGKLLLVTRKPRMGRHPRTRAPIAIPAKRVIKFRVAKPFRDAVLGKK